MAKYTLKTFCDATLLEVFDNRAKARLADLLLDARMNPEKTHDDWGDPLKVPTRFELHDGMRRKLVDGSVQDVIVALRKLR